MLKQKMAKPPLTSLELIRKTGYPLFGNKIFTRENAYYKDINREWFEVTRKASEKYIVPNTLDIHHKKTEIEELRVQLKPFYDCGIPKKFGGSGTSLIKPVILHENLAYGSASVAAHFIGQYLFSTAIALYGTDEQQKEFLPLLAKGDMAASFALTGREGGTNLTCESLAFTYQKGEYRLNGNKVFITNGAIADYAIAFARQKGGTKGKGSISAFIVPSMKIDRESGFASSPALDLTAWAGSNTSALHFDNITLQKKDIVGEKGNGMKIALDVVWRARLLIAAQALGLMERAYDEAIKSLGRKELGGRKLFCIPEVRKKLEKIANIICQSRSDIYGVAFENESIIRGSMQKLGKKVMGIVPTVNSIIHKSKATERLNAVISYAGELHGAEGLMADSPMAAIRADAAAYPHVAGANEALLAAARVLKSKIFEKQ